MSVELLLHPQAILFAVLAVMLALFVVNRIRYDIVALGGLITLALFGVVPADEVLSGFSNPVIVTIVSIFIFSAGLVKSGIVDVIGRKIIGVSNSATIELFLLMVLAAALSGFVNIVAAVSLVIPIATKVARTHNKPLGFFLMPLAFASLLGGLSTSIGTPANIVITSAREEVLGSPFNFFAFAPVGYSLAALGIIFLGFIGWRLIPKRQGKTLSSELFDVKDYLTEIQVPQTSKWVNEEIQSLQKKTGYNLSVIGIMREYDTPEISESPIRKRISEPREDEQLCGGDILIVQADSDTLEMLLSATDLVLLGSKAVSQEDLGPDAVETMEVIVDSNSPVIGESMKTLGSKAYGTNLLALARENEPVSARLANAVFKPGDVLLLRGKTETLFETVSQLGTLPLRKRELRIGSPRRIVLASIIFLGAVALSVSSALPVPLIFLLAAGTMVLTRLLPVTEIYESINWPVVVLIGSMLTIGQAFETSGAAESIVSFLLSQSGALSPMVVLAGILVFSMLLSNAIDGAAVAVIVAPIAVMLAQSLGVSVDAFLMATAVGCSSAFLTPIGAQPSALVMSPAGYHFSDYTRLGGALSVLVLVASYLLILNFWPL